MKKLLLLALLVSAVSIPVLANPAKIHRHGNAVDGEYIVVLPFSTPVEAVDGIARSLGASYELKIHKTWKYGLRGFLCHGSETAIANLTDDPRVEYAEQQFSGKINVSSSYILTDYSPGGPLWYLDRLDQASTTGNGVYYMCPDATLAYDTPIYVYMIDFDVRADHSAFQGRIAARVDFSGDTCTDCYTPANQQPQGCYIDPSATHGTAVASAITGFWGAARPQVVSLKVFRCSGVFLSSNYVDAVDWIASPANPYRAHPGVINHSGWVPSWSNEVAKSGFQTTFTTYDDEVSNVVSTTNFPFFAAAGNFSSDACGFSPQNRAYSPSRSAGKVFVVGATNIDDSRWQTTQVVNGVVVANTGDGSGSNYGDCVTGYAPVQVYAALNTATDAYAWATGTSLSSPLMAAMAARYIAYYRTNDSLHQSPTYTQVYDFLLSHSTAGTLGVTPASTYYMCPISPDHRFDNALLSPNAGPTCGTDPDSFPANAFNRPANALTPNIIYWAQYVCP